MITLDKRQSTNRFSLRQSRTCIEIQEGGGGGALLFYENENSGKM